MKSDRTSLHRASLLLATLLWASPAASEELRVTWDDVQLMAAKGVTPTGSGDHSYALVGRMQVHEATNQFQAAGPSGWATIAGEWDASQFQATEKIQLEGDLSGLVNVRFNCTSDPWITSARCTVMGAQASGIPFDLPTYYRQEGRPLTSTNVSRSKAIALSQSAGPPPPPPPAVRPPVVVDAKIAPTDKVGPMAVSAPQDLPAGAQVDPMKGAAKKARAKSITIQGQ